jgi:hypothetical protein
MAGWLRAGAEIRSTTLQKEFMFDDYLTKHLNKVVPLFAINPKSKLQCFAIGNRPEPGPEWTLISLYLPEGVEYQPEYEEEEDTDEDHAIENVT